MITNPAVRDGVRGSGARRLLLLLIGLCPAVLHAAEPTPLPEPGSVLERELAGPQVHRYALEPSPAEELWIVVAQDGVDVTLAVVGADGAARVTVDSPNGQWGEEWLLLPAGESAGDVLEIRPLTPADAPGRYRLSVESGLPGPDPRRVAQQAVTEAGRLYRDGHGEARLRARDRYREALAAWQALGRDAEAVRTLFVLALLSRQLDESRETADLLRRTLSGWRELGDRRGEAQALTELATTAWMLGESEGVEEILQQALERWRELGDLHGQARTLNYLGLVRARTAPQEAIQPYEEALELYRRIGDVSREGMVLNNLGGVHDLLGEPRAALARFRLALDVHQRLGDLRQEAAVWNNVASVDRRSGRLREALEGYNASLAACRELGDRRGEARVLNNLGLTWLSLGDASRARDVLRDAHILRRETRDRRGEAITLHNLGQAHAELEEWDAALDFWTRALALRQHLGNPAEQIGTLIAMGRAAGRLKRPAAARRHLEYALTLLDEIGNPWLRAKAWWSLGRVLTDAGEPAEAVTALERALGLYRTTGDEIGESDALLALAQAERKLDGRLAAAWEHAAAGLDLLETVRADVHNLDLRASFLSRHGEAFELAVDLAMELERRQPSADWAVKALAVSERARARSLLDLLQELGAGLRRGADAALLERQQDLLERLNAKVDRHRRELEREGPSAESERWAAGIRATRTELEEVEDAIRRQSPAWDALARPRPLGAAAVRALVDAETTLLEYSLGEERSFLWVVTADRVESFELPGRAVIEAAAREVYEGLRIHDPRARRADAEAAARLAAVVLAPAARLLTSKRLAVVADGALHYVPFAALPHPADGAPLVVGHEVVVLPSASALGVQRRVLAGRRSAARTLAVVADPVFGAPDPRLPGTGPAFTVADADPAYREGRFGDLRLERLAWTGWEAETIAGHAGDGQALLALGFDAGLDAVRGGRLKGYRVVHFATHGVVESEHPELSALVLSLVDAAGRPREGFLRLPEIYHLELDAELVVLSGCRTALGPQVRGEGLVGLTRGFFAAGARRVVASLWRVQDRSTAEFMDRFYRRLLRDGERPAAALRAAQLAMLGESELADPYHWAAFAVYGDWR